MSGTIRLTVCPGSAIFGIAAGAERQVWLATSGGLYHGSGHEWQRTPQDLPHLNTLLAIDQQLWVGGPGGLARSGDAGQTWQLSWIDQVETAVTCLAASPNFSRDQTLIVGTGGDGMLRSNDGGRHWEVANFGVRDFMVLCLAVAPAWERREVAFASMEGGLYRSPNAGRAWRRADAGLRGTVQALAVSPRFAADATVVSGTEGQGLFRSTDGGINWRRMRGAPAAALSLLWVDDGLWLGAATGVLRSRDAAKTWQAMADTSAAVLCLARVGGCTYAGLADGSLLVLPDTNTTPTTAPHQTPSPP